MTEPQILKSADALAAEIPNGSQIAIFKDSGVPMEAIRALIRRNARDLHLVTVPTGGLGADMLIGAGCVTTVETSGVTMGEFGLAPCFVRAVKSGTVTIKDATCPAVYAGLQAAEKGIPFMPLRGLIGSDILANREDFRVIDNPLAPGDSIVALPAITPDITLIHTALADRFGNIWIGRQHELKVMAHAARRTFVTVERITGDNILEDETLAANAIPALYVTGIAQAPGGARPLDMPGHYTADRDHLAGYCRRAATGEGFAGYLDETVLAEQAAVG